MTGEPPGEATIRQENVSVVLGSGSDEPPPFSWTATPTTTAWSAPALATGARLPPPGWVTVIVAESVAVPPRPSDVVSWTTYAPTTSGVNDGVAVFAFVSAAAEPAGRVVNVHANV